MGEHPSQRVLDSVTLWKHLAQLQTIRPVLSLTGPLPLSGPAQPPKRTSDGHTSPRNVSFGRNINRDEEKEKRQKYLTARYGQHQMMLIRKRLAVEDWLYDKLRNLYKCVVS